MGEGDGGRGPYLAGRLTAWRDGGGVSDAGELVTEPRELTSAKIILGLCDRWHKLPSQVLAEPAEVLRLLRVEELGIRREGGEE